MSGVTETRSYELSLYDGSIDPDLIMVLVDYNNTWQRPKRVSLSSLITGAFEEKSASLLHIERDRLTGLSSHYVTEDFDTPFASIPIGRQFLHVYRSVDLGGGQTVDELVPIYGVEVTTTGFSFYIRAEEILTDVICEYLFL